MPALFVLMPVLSHAQTATYTITANAGTGTGTITPTSLVVNANTSVNQTYTITPECWFIILDVVLDNATELPRTSSAPLNTTNTFSLSLSNVTANHTITVDFYPTHTIATSTSGNGSGGDLLWRCASSK